MTDYSFKPALLRGAVTWSVEDDCIRREGLTPMTIPYADITALRLVQLQVKVNRLERFEITAPQKRMVMGINTGPAGPEADDGLAEFYRLVIDLTGRLETTRPDLHVIRSERQGQKWAMFGIGVAALVLAAGILLAAMAGGISESRMWDAAVPLGTLFLLGVLVVANMRPWKTPPSLSLAETREWLKSGGRGARIP